MSCILLIMHTVKKKKLDVVDLKTCRSIPWGVKWWPMPWFKVTSLVYSTFPCVVNEIHFAITCLCLMRGIIPWVKLFMYCYARLLIHHCG